MAKKANEYGNESITSLKGADRVRLRPGVIFGSDGLDGCQHAVFEIVSNSIDEAREGYGKVIEVTRFLDKSIEVKDMGRGIPLDYNPKEERYNWELVFCEMYAGGKYNNIQGENYEYSLGLNGLGTCATQYSSEYMDVTVFRDKQEYNLHFEKGNIVGELEKRGRRYEHTGTIIKWRPDLDVFTDINIPLSYYQDMLKRQAVANAGIKFILNDQTTEGIDTYEYLYENGIVDYVNEISDGKEMTKIHYIEAERVGRDRDDKQDYKLKISAAFCFNNYSNLLEYYHNSSFLEHGGAPDRATKTAFLASLDKYIKNNNKYTKNESKITFVDIQDSLIFVMNSFSSVASFSDQTKKSVTNKFIQDAMTEFLKEQFDIYFIENKQDAEKIADQTLINKRSREKSEKERISIKKTLTSKNDIQNRVQKLVDCRSKDLSKREIYIVEGDSAMGACKQGRDAEFQAVIPVRGKILNCLKSDYNKIFKSDIIMDLVKVLGCGIEYKSKHTKDMQTFDIENLRWNKVIICTDADVDGYQIRTLILTMIYVLMPTLIKEGKVFIAESPLFEITYKDQSYFAYNEEEKAEIMQKLEGKKYTIQRSKGLGENQPEMMWQTTMNPETRRLIQVMPDDAEKTAMMFEILLGDNLQGRKDYITEFGSMYLDLADIS